MHTRESRMMLVVFGLIVALLVMPGKVYGEEISAQPDSSVLGEVAVADGSPDKESAGLESPAIEPANSVSADTVAISESSSGSDVDVTGGQTPQGNESVQVTGGQTSQGNESVQSSAVSSPSQAELNDSPQVPDVHSSGKDVPVASSDAVASVSVKGTGTDAVAEEPSGVNTAGSVPSNAEEKPSVQDSTMSIQATGIATTKLAVPAKRAAKAASPSISYSAHVQSIGWQGYVANGKTAGTTGKSLRLEALKIEVSGLSGGVTYSAHVQNVGWQNAVAGNRIAGTTGRGLRLEALEISLTGEIAKLYDVYYRTHVQNYGWMGWACNGTASGSVGLSCRIEALQIRLLKKGSAAPGNQGSNLHVPVLDASRVTYQGHAQNIGWQSSRMNGATSGTTGRSLRLEAIKLSVTNSFISGGIAYQAHVSGIGWQSPKAENQMAGTTGQSRSIEALCMSLSGELAKYYNIYYRAHIQNYGWLGWASNGEEAGSTGRALQMEAVQVRLVPKGMSAPGSTVRPNLDKAYVYLDAGHGYANRYAGVYDSGALGSGYRENDLTVDLVNRIASALKSKGVESFSNIDGGLYTARHSEAVSRGCTAFVSIHFNAGGGSGSESYIALSGANRAAGSARLQKTLHPYLIKGTGLKDRGMKSEDFAVVKGPLPAVLFEIAFIDNASDMSTYQLRKQTVANQLAAGIAAYTGTRKPHMLTSAQAKSAVAAARRSTSGTPIMGSSQTTVRQMVACFNAKGKSYPSGALSKGGASNITQFCMSLYNEANDEGVRAEVVFAQAMLETGWLQYGGDVRVGQFNFAGLGATGNGVRGNSFKNVATGLRAQVQHLKAYASTAPLSKACVDQRFGYVRRGCAPTVEQLSQKWATGSDYGNSIKVIMNQLLKS